VEEEDDQVANHERPEEVASEQQHPWSTTGGRLGQHDQRPEAAAVGKQGEGGCCSRPPCPRPEAGRRRPGAPARLGGGERWRSAGEGTDTTAGGGPTGGKSNPRRRTSALKVGEADCSDHGDGEQDAGKCQRSRPEGMETPTSAEPGSWVDAAGDPRPAEGDATGDQWKPADRDAGEPAHVATEEPAAGDAAASPRLAPSSTRTTMAAADRSSSSAGAGDREPISLTEARGGSRKGGTERGRREERRSGGGRSGGGRGREILRGGPPAARGESGRGRCCVQEGRIDMLT
jgi:hypothetical protein